MTRTPATGIVDRWIERFRLPLFILLVLAQLAVPATLILGRERVLAEGESFRFRTAPVDPYDAFRGRYVALAFEAAETPAPELEPPLERGERVYATLERDAEGFAVLGGVSREPPSAGPYLRVRVAWTSSDRVRYRMPFERYYLEEGSAPEAERLYREHSTVEVREAWAEVRVLDGRAVIEELWIAGEPILDFIRARAAGRDGP